MPNSHSSENDDAAQAFASFMVKNKGQFPAKGLTQCKGRTSMSVDGVHCCKLTRDAQRSVILSPAINLQMYTLTLTGRLRQVLDSVPEVHRPAPSCTVLHRPAPSCTVLHLVFGFQICERHLFPAVSRAAPVSRDFATGTSFWIPDSRAALTLFHRHLHIGFWIHRHLRTGPTMTRSIPRCSTSI